MPIAFELARIEDMKEEVFGPVLHIVRWSGDVDALVDRINALGYGLTLGVQTRIDSRAERIADRARIGNVYVNRNVIGAVVGVQPFGGEGLSGTGPKAGGPHYLMRFAAAPSPTAAPLKLNEAPPASLDAALARAHASAWNEATLDARCAWLDAVRASALAVQARQQLATQTLPGPTGERNELRLHGRGVIASIATSADAATQTQWQAALAAGNTLLVALPPAAREQAEGVFVYWQRAGALPEGAVQVIDAPFDAAVAAIAADDRVHGVIAEAGFCRRAASAPGRAPRRDRAAVRRRHERHAVATGGGTDADRQHRRRRRQRRAARRASIQLDAELVDHRPPALHVGVDDALEVGRAAADRGQPLRIERALHRRVLQHLVDIGVDARHHRLRRARRGEQAVPGQRLDVRIAGGGQRRHVLQRLRPLGRC